MPTYTDHCPDDGFFYWVPSSRSERIAPSERLAQSIAESSPLDQEIDALVCNLASLNLESIAPRN